MWLEAVPDPAGPGRELSVTPPRWEEGKVQHVVREDGCSRRQMSKAVKII